MADYFTQFSCILDVGSAENAIRAESIRSEMAAELERDEGTDLRFDMEIDDAHGPGALWISSDGYGEPEHVIRFALACAAAFDLTGRWGLAWALTCSKPRLDGFGGGAQMLDLGARSSIDWVDCDHWLGLMSEDPEPAVTPPGRSAKHKLHNGSSKVHLLAQETEERKPLAS